VTNAIDYTEKCDRVLVMKEGRIEEDGNPDDLNSNKDNAYALLRNDYKKSVEQEEEDKQRHDEEVKMQKKKSEDQIDIE
jgi:ABC-type multidrug transport system ATPase subunit